MTEPTITLTTQMEGRFPSTQPILSGYMRDGVPHISLNCGCDMEMPELPPDGQKCPCGACTFNRVSDGVPSRAPEAAVPKPKRRHRWK